MAVYHLNYHTLEGNVGQDATVGQTANGEYYSLDSREYTGG